ncbi:MAG: hypothetical protein CMH30_02195 [Micavibrio sp.]|nr:hypothetical protein [Micavibrio sp.]|tara:strand:- start:54 stop:398 length:345 start_codon:yes stop_codon:yes gene_type:complete
MIHNKPLWSGLCGRCPNCGQGKLFKSYLKQHNECAVCHENFSHINAEDAPPWLTILIVGHIVAPFLIFFKQDVFSEAIDLALVVFMALFLVITILPLAKGFFIAAIWLTQKKKV